MESIRQKFVKRVGLRLRELRDEVGMSQRELGRRMGVDHKYISYIERGKVDPGTGELFVLSLGLGINIQELFRFSGDTVWSLQDVEEIRRYVLSAGSRRAKRRILDEHRSGLVSPDESDEGFGGAADADGAGGSFGYGLQDGSFGRDEGRVPSKPDGVGGAADADGAGGSFEYGMEVGPAEDAEGGDAVRLDNAEPDDASVETCGSFEYRLEAGAVKEPSQESAGA